jgi:hypothetical protein
MLNLLLTVPVRRTSGLVLAKQEGHGGGHQVRLGDADRLQHASSRYKPVTRSRSLIGGSSGQHASQWSEQSGHRNALSPAQRVSPRQRAGSRSCIRPPSWSQSHPANAGQAERQAVYQTQQYRGLVVGRAVVPSRGMTGGMGEVCP